MKQKHFIVAFLAMLMCFASPTFAQAQHVAKIGEQGYNTLKEAMGACVAGDNTITLLQDNAEVFTFAQKSGVNITIDGEGNTFSGKITLSAGGGNLNFTDAKIAPANSQTISLSASTAPNVTFDGCTLQGTNKSGTIVYGDASATSNSITVKNCTADNLQYIVSHRQTGAKSVWVENVTATNMIYLVRTLKCPNVTIKNVTCDAVIGIDIKNDGAGGKLTLEDVNINVYTYGGTTYFPVNGSGAGASWTITTKGTNTFTKNGVAYEGNEWFSGNDGYKIVDANVAMIGNKAYSTLAAAIAAAESGATVELKKDIVVDNTIVIPAGKSITLDLKGKTISQVKACTASYQMIENNGNLTITGNGKLSFKDNGAGDPNFGWGSYTINNRGTLVVENGTIEHLGEQNPGNGQPNKHMYCAIFQYSGSTTINGGTISTPTYRSARLWKGEMIINGGTFDGQVWAQAVDNTANLVINGGTFTPKGNDASSVFVENNKYDVQFAVTDGTFNGKVGCSDATKLAGVISGGKFTEVAKNGTNATLIAQDVKFGELNNGYYEVEDVVKAAKIGDTKYKTFDEAYEAASNGTVIELLQTAVLTANKNYTKAVTVNANFGATAFRVQNDATVTFGGFTINSNDYCFILGAKDASSAGNLKIQSGTYNGVVTAVSVTKGELTIAGRGNTVPTFKVEPYEGSYDYTINCIDANYKSGDAKVAISNGKFYNFDPANNAAEGKGTNFLKANTAVATVKGEDGYYACVKAVAKVNDKYYATFDEAVAAAKPGDTLKLLEDATITKTINAAGLTIEGKGTNDPSTLTYTGSGASARAITVESDANGANLTIKNLIVDCTANYCQRGINYNTTGELTLDNVTVKGKNVTYALNLPGSSVGANVTINKSSLTGNIALNVWGENAIVNVENTTLTAVDNNSSEGYAAVKLNNDGTTAAEGAEINITGGKIDVTGTACTDTKPVSNATSTGTINIDKSTTVNGEVATMVAVIRYANGTSYSFTKIEDAIAKAQAGETVTLLRDLTSSAIIVLDKAITLDGNGKTLDSKATRAINVAAEGVTIKNLTIDAKGERAINVIQNATNVTIENVTATAANYTVNVAASAPNAVVAISNSTLNGLCTVNVAAAGAKVTVKNSTVNCNDNNTTAGESYAALSLNKEAVGGSIVATNSTINVAEGSDSMKGRNGAENGTVTINGSTDGVAVMVAAITYPNSNYYHAFATLKAAVEYAQAGQTVTLLRDATGAGVVINKSITIDFNGKTYTVNEGVGSTGTTTLGLQILKENNVVLKNGTLKSTAVTEGNQVKMLVQNYANLTIEDMNLVDETEHILYVLSNNSGNVVVKGNTNITTDAVAFDACTYANYDAPTVTVEEGVVVKGNVEVSATLNMNATLEGSILLNATTGVVNTTKEYNVTTDVANSKVVLNNGAYTVEAVNYVAKVGEQGYETLAAALAAATAGQTITLAADVTENVTISKAVTIEGAGKTYTGKMTVGNFAVTIENVNFVKGSIDANASGSARALVVKNCAFDGVDNKSIAYAITQRHGASVVIENSSAKNYSVGMLYIPQNVAAITIKNVTVENVAAAFNISYSGDASFENVTLNNVTYGLHVQNHGARTFTMKNWKSNAGYLTYVQNKGTAKVTFKFDGKIELGEGQLHNSQYAIYKNAAVVDGNESVIYGSLTDALADGSEVKLLTDFVAEGAVINKNATIDFNGKTYTVNKTVGSTGTTTLGLQILKGNDVVLKNGTLKSTAVTEGNQVKMLVQNYANLTVENMNLVDETEHILYVLSNNSGNVVVKGNTNITTDAVAFDACKYANYDVPTVTVETTGKIAGAIEVTGGNLAIKGGTYTVNVADWCDSSYICKANADRTFSVIYNPTINNVAKVGDNYYPTLRAAVDAAPAGATVELIKDVVLEGGYADDPDAGLRIEKAITIRGKHTIDCGNFTKGIRVYNNSGNKSIVSFYNLTIVNNNAYGRCIDTRSGNIDLLLYVTNLKATGTNSQPLTLGGNERLYRARIQASTIDAGTTGYGVICFVPSWGGITASTGSKIKGYAAFYIKDGVNKTTITLDKGTYTGINTFNQGSGVFGAVVVEGDNNTIKVADPNTVVYAVSGNGADKAHQAAFFVAKGATGNQILITNANVTTNGDCTHFAMVHTDVANSTSLVKDGVNMQLVAECNGYQFVTLEEAFNFAVNNSTVKLLADVTLDTKNVVTECDGYASIINVEGKAITFDLNGKAMTVNANAADLADAKNKMLLAVFSTDEGGNLTLTDSSDDKTGAVVVNANDATVYSVVANYTNGCYVTINGGNYIADKVHDSMIYTGANEAVVVNGGKFTLGNVGTGANGKPWIFNALGQNERHVTVNGGTFNADVLHQYWVFEVNAPKERALTQNEDGTWTMVDAVAYVTEKHGKYNNYVGYATIEEAIACNNKADNTVTLAKEVVEITNMITVSKDETLVLNLNGKTIAAIDNTTKNYSAIDNRGNLTITGNGKITVKANVNSGWNRYSAVIANNPGGKLTVENGTIEHLGGTDMAYGIDNLTNGKGTYAETTIDGGLVKSPYRAVRQFLNGVEAQNILTVNGGTLEGANKSIFFHDPSKNANSGTLYVDKDAILKGDVYLFVTAGSAEWPVEVEIAKAALGESKVLYANVPKNFAVVEYPAYWTVEALIVDELTIEDNCYEYINKLEKTVGTLTYAREFEDTEWQTIYLPFAVPAANLMGEFEVAYIYNAGYKNGSATIDFVKVEDEEFELAANYPYLIRAKEAGYKEIVVENATLMPTTVETIDCSSVFETFSFIGSYSSVAKCDATKRYFVLNDGAWVSMSEPNPFRFYLQIKKRDGSSFSDVQSIRMRSVDMNGIENATGVESVDAEQNVDYIFDVHGRRVVEPQKGGIYIINGVKVIF